MRPCLILVDLQAAFLDDRRLEPARERLLAGASAWLAEFRRRQLPVVHVRTTVLAEGGPALPHWDARDRARLTHGSAGWHFAPQAAPREGEPIADKTHYSGFQSGVLVDLLRRAGAGRVVIGGVHLHGCVRSTALDASAAGFEVEIGIDATGSNDPPHAAATRRWLGERGFRLVELACWEHDVPPAPAPPAGRVEAVAERAAAAFAGWAALAPERRIELLRPLGDLLRGDARGLAEAIAIEIHKPLKDALAEVSFAADLADQATTRMPEPELRTPDGLARRVPHGPVLSITPWNNPVALPVGKIAPALAMGNTVVWKPSPLSSSTSRSLHDLLRRLELPAGALGVVEGGGGEAAALVRGGSIRAVSVTGSLEAGRALHDLCAARLIPLQAELGGNNAALVCADADIDATADELVAGAFGFAGQRCTATRRAIVVGSAYAPLLDAVKARVERLRAGDPLSSDVDFPPLVSAAAAARVEALIDRAAAAGAAIWRPRWSGERAFGSLRGQLPFVAPAVVEGAEPDSEVVREESFGPVLVMTGVGTLDEAMERCNDVPQGLVASIHARAPGDVDRFTREVHAGILKRNRSTAGAAASLPFGGFGVSGVGPPEHGAADAEFYTRWQAIYDDQDGRERWAAPDSP